MTWFRVDDGLHSHPKRHRAGLKAMGLWVRAQIRAALHEGQAEARGQQ